MELYSKRCARDHRAGFTVAEVVISSAILTMIFGVVLGVMSYGRRSSSLAENRLASLHMARQALETLSNYSFDSTNMAVGTTVLSTNQMTYYQITKSADGLTKYVTVFVGWREPLGATQSVSVATAFSRSLHK